jgi:hypothetical protein
MAQFAVVGYQVMVSTNPPAVPGAPAFVPRVTITIQVGPSPQQVQSVPLPMTNEAEFLALCAMMQLPGRLIFDQQQGTLEKVTP